MNGSVLAQSRSVKHYEAVDDRDFITSISFVSGRKGRHKLRNGKEKAEKVSFSHSLSTCDASILFVAPNRQGQGKGQGRVRCEGRSQYR